MKTVLLAALALSFALPAAAAPASQAKKLAGVWNLSEAPKSGGRCKLTLSAKAVKGGMSVDPSSGCSRDFPRLKAAAAWAVTDAGKAIEINDSQRRRIYRFEKADRGQFITAPNKDDRQFILAKGEGAKEPSDRDSMSGAWSVTGENGKPRCAFTSKANKAGTEGTLTEKRSPGCPSRWKAVGWSGWTLKGERLDLLNARGKVSHTLKENGDGSFEGRTRNGDALYFSRD